MSACEAIKSKQQIEEVERFILRHYGTHYSDIWRLGVNVALRVSDILGITCEQAKVSSQSGFLILKEGKTKKERAIKLNATALRIIRGRIEESPTDVYLFQSHCRNVKRVQPLSRQGVYEVFREAGRNINVRMGTHTMRKTRGYMMHSAGIPLEMICKMFNHSHPAVTMSYIGLTQQAIDKTYDDIEL
jgi:integrase